MKNLRNLRESKGLTQKEIASKLNLTRANYSHYENGRSNVPNEILIKISETFNVSVDYLIGIINEPLTTEENYILRNLDHPNEIIEKKYKMKLSGYTLSEEEVKKILQFLKMLRDV